MKANSTNHISSHQIYSRSDPKAIKMVVNAEKNYISQVEESAKAMLNLQFKKNQKSKGKIRESELDSFIIKEKN